MDSAGGGTEVESIIFHFVSVARVGVGCWVLVPFRFRFGLGRRAAVPWFREAIKQRREFEI